MTNFVTLSHFLCPQERTIDLSFRNNRIRKHEGNFKAHPQLLPCRRHKCMIPLNISEGILERTFVDYEVFGRLMISTPLFMKKILSLFVVSYCLEAPRLFTKNIFRQGPFMSDTTE